MHTRVSDVSNSAWGEHARGAGQSTQPCTAKRGRCGEEKDEMRERRLGLTGLRHSWNSKQVSAVSGARHVHPLRSRVRMSTCSSTRQADKQQGGYALTLPCQGVDRPDVHKVALQGSSPPPAHGRRIPVHCLTCCRVSWRSCVSAAQAARCASYSTQAPSVRCRSAGAAPRSEHVSAMACGQRQRMEHGSAGGEEQWRT